MQIATLAAVSPLRISRAWLTDDKQIGIKRSLINCRRARMSHRAVKIFFDGGARPNPGQMETAVVVRGVAHYLADLGHGTSTDAEWLALIAALGVAHSLALPHFVLLGDSAAVIDQANRRSPCRSLGLHSHLDRFEAMGGVRPSRIRWIARTQNLAGIALEARRRRAA